MFVFNCVALSIFMSITLVLFIKKEYIFGKLTILPTIAVAFFTVLLVPVKGTVIDMNKIMSNDTVIVTEKGGTLEITPAYTYYILVETRSGNHYIEEVDYEIKIGDTYTSPWCDTFGK